MPKSRALAALRAFLWREEDVDANDFIVAHVKNRESAEVLLKRMQVEGEQPNYLKHS